MNKAIGVAMQSYLEFKQYTQRLYEVFQTHDATKVDRLDKFRNIEPESAEFLAMLVRLQQSKQILEIGTSTGYSTLWLAYASKSTQGRLISLEIQATRLTQAQQYLADFSLDDVVELKRIDAQLYLENCQQHFDFILLDAERDAYVAYWPYLAKCLSKNAVLVVDNVLSHAHQVAEFIALVQQDERFSSQTLAIGAGLFFVQRL